MHRLLDLIVDNAQSQMRNGQSKLAQYDGYVGVQLPSGIYYGKVTEFVLRIIMIIANNMSSVVYMTRAIFPS